MHARDGLLTEAELRKAVGDGSIHTVLLVLVDMQGRLQGKRCSARYFLEEVLPHGAEACNYLLAVDVEMNTVDGYALTSWESGYGDFEMVPDLETLRLLPWQPGSALVFADLRLSNGEPVAPSPRQVLDRQRARLTERGWYAVAGTELEFIVYRDTYEAAWQSGYRNLTPANLYNLDYSILGTSRVEPLLSAITLSMAGAGLYVESAKGECNLGQQEIAFRYDEAQVTADNHALYKNGAKEIAALQGCSLTFMAKIDEREGNSCHIHLSLRTRDSDDAVLAGPDGSLGTLGSHFLAGQLATLREFSLLFAPNINSYKRFAPGSFAPTAVAWGHDNRTCALRLVGRGPSLRVENRLPGGDVNPYLGLAAVIASGLHGIENELPLPEPCVGNAYTSGAPTVPTTLREALDLWESSTVARNAFGDEVVEHYANMARVELAAFDSTVTDWERRRGFERL
ncbi:glutamine synthetase family protein [Pseudonocardia spinosispora]|uniref:glutamine synthetase family protein n=1 Tax=Pseudonocardia spinosispora TaxID=103441 RepID=UPI00048D2E5D|nr:glutamine synthetase family protein [Pseudonocardia spinosispora]